MGVENTKKLEQLLFSIERTKNVRELTAVLVLEDNAAIDATTI
jgi:hypothetical protein